MKSRSRGKRASASNNPIAEYYEAERKAIIGLYGQKKRKRSAKLVAVVPTSA